MIAVKDIKNTAYLRRVPKKSPRRPVLRRAREEGSGVTTDGARRPCIETNSSSKVLPRRLLPVKEMVADGSKK